MSAALIAFIEEALTLAPLVMQAYSTISALVTHVVAVVSSGNPPTDADVAQLKAIRDQAQAVLDQRAADAANVGA